MPPTPPFKLSPLKLSDAEWTVMHALWSAAPASARDVLDRVGTTTGWAYTTVKTMLARLAEKGAVDATSQGNQVLYTPRVSRDQAQRSAVRTLVDRVFGGAVDRSSQSVESINNLGCFTVNNRQIKFSGVWTMTCSRSMATGRRVTSTAGR